MKKRTLEEIKDDLSYELAAGIHTYHDCSYCAKNYTRAGMCYECLLNIADKLYPNHGISTLSRGVGMRIGHQSDPTLYHPTGLQVEELKELINQCRSNKR